ncbi:hypothetical protein [Rubritalea tangerina]|uniref:Uncharacterized protein n=1 Tax=Rubritalea tangerina TaxID=430798 RepID=A0ABW4ZBS1_9BACT
MRYRQWLWAGFLIYVCGFVEADEGLERSMEKLAAGMLRACPELKGGQRTVAARRNLVEEFEALGADKISLDYLKKIRRSKVDYERADWLELVAKFERAGFVRPRGQFLMGKARAQKMRAEEFYLVKRLMDAYYDLWIEEREEEERRSMRRVGKAYSTYISAYGVAPKCLEDFLPEEACFATDPRTNHDSRWVYVGGGPWELRGANRYRVVAYASYPCGRQGVYRWVIYKGGLVGEWKEETLVKSIAKVERDYQLLQIAKKAEATGSERDDQRVAKSTTPGHERVKAVEKPSKKPKLKITIVELW